MKSPILSIDIETYCDKDLAKCSVYSYIEDKSFEILLFAFAFDDEEVQIIDLKNGEKIPNYIIEAIYDKTIIKSAFNANFERLCLSKHFNREIDKSFFRCTMINALYLGLPGSLEKLGEVLNLQHKKISEGKNLIKLFCTNKGKKELPKDNINKWEDFKNYCKRDVEVEREIRNIFKNYPLPKNEINIWQIDQTINDRGILIDENLIDKCLETNLKNNNILLEKMKNKIEIKNPKSVVELKKYLQENFNFKVDSLNDKATKEILESDIDENIKEILKLRREICKTSLKKFDAMKNCVCQDGRIRGLFQFYGASRTGRWAGRLVQVHNLPQNKMENLDLFRTHIKNCNCKNLHTIESTFGKISEALPQLIRTAFIPKNGYKFIIADFSAIEARIIAWISGETWRNEVFKSHGKIYEASAARMFNMQIDDIGKDSIYRQKGKIAELALGYQGGKGALITMGADKMGLSTKDLENLVKSFRKSNPNIVRLWKTVEQSVLYAVENKTSTSLNNIKFIYERGMLFIKLPSGRYLSYVRPRIDTGIYGKKLSYEGINQSIKKWERIDTYGGKLVENIVQGIARDCLAHVMYQLENKNFNIVMHVHDEVVIEIEKHDDKRDKDNINIVKNIMEESISWASGLTLKVDLFDSEYYKKG
ncbi:DNA polymerase [Clostridium sp.]|uniref:DNA polymerase n=1 Tax=Clostridium sp. TaxID=1506 RepID=UPI002FC615F3